MTSNVDQNLYNFPQEEILFSYLKQHPNSKSLKFGNDCPTHILIKETANYFANSSISHRTLFRTNKIQDLVAKLFNKYNCYEHFDDMNTVKKNLHIALGDCLVGIKIEELNNRIKRVKVITYRDKKQEQVDFDDMNTVKKNLPIALADCFWWEKK